jgi:hypothetical protein
VPSDRGGRPLVFVSHVSEDKQRLKPYLQRLLDAGVDLFVDRPEEVWGDDWLAFGERVRAIRTGDAWRVAISDAHKEADNVLIFLSERFHAKYMATKADVKATDILMFEVLSDTKKNRCVVIDNFDREEKGRKHLLLREFTIWQLRDVAVALDHEPGKVGHEHPRFTSLLAELAAGASADVAAPKVEPRRDAGLLARLINRREQEIDVRRAVRVLASARIATGPAAAPASGAPVCFVAWGPRQEDFDALVRRLSRYTLHREDDGKRKRHGPATQDFAIQWPPLDSWLDAATTWDDYLHELRHKLGLPHARSVEPATLAKALAGKLSAAVISARIDRAMWTALVEQGLVKSWIEYWTATSSAFRAQFAGNPEASDTDGALIALLCMETDQPPAAVDGLRVLKRLTPVTLDHLEEWWTGFQDHLAPATQDDFKACFVPDAAGVANLPMAEWVRNAENKMRQHGLLK